MASFSPLLGRVISSVTSKIAHTANAAFLAWHNRAGYWVVIKARVLLTMVLLTVLPFALKKGDEGHQTAYTQAKWVAYRNKKPNVFFVC